MLVGATVWLQDALAPPAGSPPATQAGAEGEHAMSPEEACAHMPEHCGGGA